MLRSQSSRSLRPVSAKNRYIDNLRRDQQRFQPVQGRGIKIRQTSRGTIIEADPGKGGGTSTGDPVWLP